MERNQLDIRVVAAQLAEDGEIRDVVAVFPPDAATLTPDPEAFVREGDLAIMTLEPGTPTHNIHEFTTDMMFTDAERRAGYSRMISSVALEGVVTLPTLSHITTRDLRQPE